MEFKEVKKRLSRPGAATKEETQSGTPPGEQPKNNREQQGRADQSGDAQWNPNAQELSAARTLSMVVAQSLVLSRQLSVQH